MSARSSPAGAPAVASLTLRRRFRHLLQDAGLAIETLRPVVFAAAMSDFTARWPMGFAREYLPSMIANGDVSAAEGETLSAILSDHEANPNAFVITPGVLQIIARK
jgi:hypothetical protein